jgi:hypothetical protein
MGHLRKIRRRMEPEPVKPAPLPEKVALFRLIQSRLSNLYVASDEEIVEALYALEREGKITDLVFTKDDFRCRLAPMTEEEMEKWNGH